MYKITCLTTGGAEYHIVMRPVVRPEQHFMTEMAADWSPPGEHLGQSLDERLRKGEPPILQNYGKEVLAAFTPAQLHEALLRAREIEVSKIGPQLRRDTITVWKWDSEETIWVKCVT